MEEFSPPVKDRELDDLLYVYLAPRGDWQDEVIRQTTEELYRRGITEEQLKIISENYKLEQEEEIRKYQEQLEKNAKESYSILTMILIFFGAPLIFYPNNDSFGAMTVSELKRENFKIKYRQRLSLLIGGGIFWLILFNIALNS